MVRQNVTEEVCDGGKHPMEARKVSKVRKKKRQDLVPKNPFFSMRSILALIISFSRSRVI